MLGGGVGAREGRAGLPGGAGHDGDGAAAVGDEVGDDEAGEVHDGEDVQLEHVLVNLQVGKITRLVSRVEIIRCKH